MVKIKEQQCDECKYAGLCYGNSKDSYICAKYREVIDYNMDDFYFELDKRIEDEKEECVVVRG